LVVLDKVLTELHELSGFFITYSFLASDLRSIGFWGGIG